MSNLKAISESILSEFSKFVDGVEDARVKSEGGGTECFFCGAFFNNWNGKITHSKDCEIIAAKNSIKKAKAELKHET